MTNLGIYIDDPLTTLFSTFNGIINESTNQRLKAGSPEEGIIHRRKTLPGTNQLQVALVDNNTGDIVELENFRFALTEVGLAAATPGAPLNLGTTIESGVDGAVEFWMQYTDTSGTVAEFLNAVTLTILDVEDAPA